MKEQDQTLLVWVLALVISFSIGYFALSPLLADYRDHRTIAAARTNDLENLAARRTQLDRLAQQLERHRTNLDRLALAVPTTPQTPELVSQLAGLAESAGVSLLTIEPARASSTGVATVVTVTVQGGYPEMIGLAERIERNLRPAKVSSINFVRAGGDSGQLTGTLEVQFAQIVDPGEGGVQ